jgi:NACHT domain
LLNSSAIIQDVMALRRAGSACMAYFYCDFRDEDKQSHRNILLSILSQLSTQSNLCFDALLHFYLEHDKGAQKPSDSALINCLKEMLSHRSEPPFYLILDALDECPNNSGMPSPREQVLDLVKDLVELSLPNLHICVTSRPEIDIRDALEPLTSLRVSLHDQTEQRKDIIQYVRSVVYSDAKIRRYRKEDKILVIETLSERADGM